MATLTELAGFSGACLAALAFFWLVALAFERGAGWGLGVALFPPLALVVAARHWRRAWEPLAIGLAGAAMALGPWLARRPEAPGRWRGEALAWLGSEPGAFLLLISGLGLVVVGFLGLVIAAFRVRAAWGLGVLFVPPTAAVFVPRHWSRARGAAGLVLLGLVVAAAPFALTRYLAPIDLGPRDRVVDGERHLTLTGWDRRDYDVLGQKRDVVVLQMANPDVTDATLERLAGLSRLRELDLGGTAITDRGLGALARLPALEILRLNGTAITDAGFREALAPKESLRLLDLRGTAVTAETVQAWRRARPGRRALR